MGGNLEEESGESAEELEDLGEEPGESGGTWSGSREQYRTMSSGG